MTIASEIEDLQTNLAAAKAAVTAAGGTVGDTGLAGLATEIASIPGGGGDTPTDWGIVYYYDAFDLSIEEVRGENCSAEVTNQQLLLNKILEAGMTSVDMMFDYQPGEGWMSGEFGDTPYTTEELLTVFGITVSDFDENDWAMLEILGKIALVKNGSPQRMVLTGVEEYNSLTSISESPVVHLIKIVKFTFGSSATSVPNSFLSNCQNLETINTDYASSITTIGNDVFSYSTEIVGKIRFENATTVGYSFLSSVKYVQVELPNVTNVGSSFCTGILRMPSLPKLEQAGDGFLKESQGFPQGADTIGINVFETMPNLVSLGKEAFSNCLGVAGVYLFRPVSQVCPNLQHIGAGFCGGCNNLVDCSNIDQSWIDIIDDDNAGNRLYSFAAKSGSSASYLAGIKASANFITKFPEVSRSGIAYRKYRTS